MTSRALRSLKSLNNSKLPDLARDVFSIRLLHLPCEFADTLQKYRTTLALNYRKTNTKLSIAKHHICYQKMI